MKNLTPTLDQGEFVLYQIDDGISHINLRAIDGTVWLTQAEMAELFDRKRNTITEYIQTIFNEKELTNSVCRNLRHTASDGKTF